MMSAFAVTPTFFVIPAKAGIQFRMLCHAQTSAWIPAFAGMTGRGL